MRYPFISDQFFEGKQTEKLAEKFKSQAKMSALFHSLCEYERCRNNFANWIPCKAQPIWNSHMTEQIFWPGGQNKQSLELQCVFRKWKYFFSFFPEFSPRKLAHKIQPTKNHEKKIKNQHEKNLKKSSLEALKTYKLLFNRKEICWI